MCSGVVRARGWHFCQESGKIKSGEAFHLALNICVKYWQFKCVLRSIWSLIIDQHHFCAFKMDEWFHNVHQKYLFKIAIVLLFKRPKDFSKFKHLLFCNKSSSFVTASSCILTCSWQRFDHWWARLVNCSHWFGPRVSWKRL